MKQVTLKEYIKDLGVECDNEGNMSITGTFLRNGTFYPATMTFKEKGDAKDHIPEQVIYNGTTTVVVFPDGDKVTSRPTDDDDFDKETGLAMCIAKHVYGSRADFVKAVEKANDQNAKMAKKEKQQPVPFNRHEQPSWCNFEFALDEDLGCQHLQRGFVNGEGAVVCKQCGYAVFKKAKK